jgi:FkbM family methyltransferase
VKAIARLDRAFLDVGANRGTFLEVALGRYASLHAVEPNPRLARYLRDAFGDRVDVIEAALSSRDGTMTLFVPRLANQPLNARGSLQPDANAGLAQDSFTVPVRRLDDLELPPLALIKVDVEGHEAQVIAGGKARLAADRPVLLVEIEERHHPGRSDEVPDTLMALGYEAFYLSGGTAVPLHGQPISELQPAHLRELVAAGRHHVSGYVNNFLFVHRSDASSREMLARARLLHR